MDKTVITFGNTEIGNTNFNNIKILFLMNNINVYKIVVVSYKISLGKNGFKKFIGYKDAKKVGPFCIFLLKMNAYRKGLMKRNICLFY